jgi:polyphosphate kinase
LTRFSGLTCQNADVKVKAAVPTKISKTKPVKARVPKVQAVAVPKPQARAVQLPKPRGLQISRERSWLTFNHRVLLQATRPDFPLLERVRFLAIFANNLDEFFTARAQSLRAKVRLDGQKLRAEYLHLLRDALAFSLEAAKLHDSLCVELAAAGIHILKPDDLEPDELAFFGAYLAERVAPLTDIIAPDGLPYLDSRALYFAAGQARIEYFFRVPESVPRLLEIPGRKNSFVRLEDLIASRSDLFLPEPSPVWLLRLTRGANIKLKGNVDWEDLAHALEGRLDGPPARLEVQEGFPSLEALRAGLGLWSEEVFELPLPLDYRFLDAIANLNRIDLRFKPNPIRKRSKFQSAPFTYLEKQDLALYHPSDDYGTVVQFVQAVAKDPRTESIRATLYRLGRNNPIAEGLLEAARAGKDVAVFLEGRARFDELANLYWQLRFKEGGVRVFPYPPDLKVHAKALYVKRGGRGYVHLGTGNYNPATGKLYTDLSLLSADPGLTKDASTFFKALEQGIPPKLELMKVGLQAREFMLERIKAESHAKGHIILKLNHLTDPAVLLALETAAEAGAKVDLIIRSTLTTIHPQFKARSLVGRYLEHSRIAAFKCAGEWEVWAGSADWMPRNFERRLELIFPILKKKVRSQVLEVLKAQIADNRNAFVLGADGSQKEIWGGTRDSQIVRL